ncbi:hypothetical protein M433DRAFT_73240 [Acidomyces richmondensis BFW]|nr:MAG: hypothetical protein FE78DRAFT_136200 [Acidomyces sp. 'richmondensis']KYG42695.1 hypothetical protein M433DRAFT_73240 [Acidomyces richmondensis BFW]
MDCQTDSQVARIADGRKDHDNLMTESLDRLQSQGSRKVMDMIDKLRRSGLTGIVQLPQIVVCGDQSSGKSSVLEAITEIPFPRKENLCTRFATEIILLRATSPSISTKITPDKTRPKEEIESLEKFNRSIEDFSQLPALIEEATKVMGLIDDGSGPAQAFSRDVLRVVIAGPGRPHLTLVDLPGLIHTENKMQSKQDVELIHDLVYEYISQKRTIIMAVVSAKNDYANQIILKKCRDVDPKGSRTIGIITKPDFLEPDSENELSWIELAQNKDIFLDLGWHILKNRSEKETTFSFAERKNNETAFFAKGRYRDLPRDMLGIDALCTRLTKLLERHLRTELPALHSELREKHCEICRELSLLGEKRSTLQEQRRFLMNASTQYQDIVKAAVNGQYEHEFFGDLDADSSVYQGENVRRLRAVVQYLNLQFATTMRLYGHKLRVIEEGEESTDDGLKSQQELDDDYAYFSDLQEVISRKDAIKRVLKILIRSRGRELPGTFNPLLISQLFWEQSAEWKTIAEFHIDKIGKVCSDFVAAAIDFTMSPVIGHRLQSLKIQNALDQRLNSAKDELARIIADTKLHPITYDPTYTDIVQRVRQERHETKVERLVEDVEKVSFNSLSHPQKQLVRAEVIKQDMKSLIEPDMDKTSSEDALDCAQAFYQEEVNYFVSAITKQVIERHLLSDLAGETLSPMLINDMMDDEIAFVAAEPEETVRMRSNLEARKTLLDNGLETFKSTLGLRK